jgi:HD-GYP domain-containing protein (c-di-GMP phosphodiesterase class II)
MSAIKDGTAGVAFIIALQRAIAAARRPQGGDDLMEACRVALDRAIAEHGAAALRADLDEEQFLLNEIPVVSRRNGRALAALLAQFAARGIAEIRFSRVLKKTELATFVGLVVGRGAPAALEPTAACRKIVEGLWDTGLRGSVDLTSLEQTGHAQARAIKVGANQIGRLTYARLLVLLSEYLSNPGDELRRHITWKMTRAVQGLVVAASSREREFLGLAQVRGADTYPVNHAVNTCVLSVLLGLKIGLPRPLLTELGFAALLCWSGKLRTEPAIVNKPGPSRSPEEAKEYGRHPYRALGSLLDFHRLEEPLHVAAIVGLEFEYRKGCPTLRRPLKEIHPLAQIVSICEIFDALTTPRQGSPPPAPHTALEKILELNRPYDPTLVQLFTALVAKMSPAPSLS